MSQNFSQLAPKERRAIFRRARLSLLSGAVVYLLFLNLGCVSMPEVSVNADDPSVTVKTTGIYFDEMKVEVDEVAPILEQAEVPHDRTIHILLDEGVTDLKPARTLMGTLALAGYTRPVLVTKRHAMSETVSAEESARRRRARTLGARQTAPPRKIRYKGVAE